MSAHFFDNDGGVVAEVCIFHSSSHNYGVAFICRRHDIQVVIFATKQLICAADCVYADSSRGIKEISHNGCALCKFLCDKNKTKSEEEKNPVAADEREKEPLKIDVWNYKRRKEWKQEREKERKKKNM